jgi:hypothetical protein
VSGILGESRSSSESGVPFPSPGYFSNSQRTDWFKRTRPWDQQKANGCRDPELPQGWTSMADEGTQLVIEPFPVGNSSPETEVRHFIETVLVSILDEISKTDGHPTVTIARRSANAMHFLNQETGALESRHREPVLCSYSWPGSTVQEAWRFGMLCLCLCLCSCAICFNIYPSVLPLVEDTAYQPVLDCLLSWS